MKVQAINNGHSVNPKGHLTKIGKYTNLAYSALFATSLLCICDSFSKSSTKEQSTTDTEIVTTDPQVETEKKNDKNSQGEKDKSVTPITFRFGLKAL